MGTFKARVSLNDGEPMDVLYATTKVHRKVDQKGKATTRIQGIEISVRVEAEEKSDIIEAMINDEHKLMDLKLEYLKNDDGSVMRTTEGKGGYITNYNESLDTTADEHASIYFTCFFNTVTIGKAAHTSEWHRANLG